MPAFGMITADAERIEGQTVYVKQEVWVRMMQGSKTGGPEVSRGSVVSCDTTGSSGKQCRPAQLGRRAC